MTMKKLIERILAESSIPEWVKRAAKNKLSKDEYEEFFDAFKG